MYLHHILRRPSDEPIKKFYKAQKSKPSIGDWVKLVEEDRKNQNNHLEDDEIYQLSKYRSRKIVKKSLKERAFEDLTKKKESHSKMNGVEYDKSEVQKYLKSNSRHCWECEG